jgi:hypothetical protein
MGEDTMTDPGQLGQASDDSSELAQEAHEPSRDTQQQPTARFSLPRNKGAWLGITLSLIALAAVSAALIAVVGRGGSHQATSSTSGATGTAPGTIPAAPVTPAPSSGVSKAKDGKVPSAAQVAESGGALSLPANMQSQVVTWQFGRGGTGLTAVSSLFGTALQERALRQYPLMRSTCAQLARSVPTAQAGPPIPVVAMQALYVKALAELAKGAADCQAAISVTPNGDEALTVHVNAAVLNQSVAEVAAGSKDIFRSTAEIEIVSRQAH